jgi:hypothetical protein
MSGANHKRYSSTIERREDNQMLSLADYIQLKEQKQYLQACIKNIQIQGSNNEKCAIIEDNIRLKTQVDNLKAQLAQQELNVKKAKFMITDMQQDSLIGLQKAKYSSSIHKIAQLYPIAKYSTN